MAGANKKTWMAAGGLAAAGAAAFYFLDRKRGPERRRAFTKGAKRVGATVIEGTAKSARDSWHHVAGMARSTWSEMVGEPLEDRVLMERIRARMGRIVSHPHKIHAAVDHGVATLWGMAVEGEIRKLVHAIESMHGIIEVINHLEHQEEPAAAVVAQNPVKQAHQKALLHWSPAVRLLVGATGATAAIYGSKRGDRLGRFLAALGAGLAAVSTLEKNVPALLAFSEDSPGFELEETIRINAPVSDIYDFWANPENYAKVFSHISAVERLGENLYRWTVDGPGGIPIHWEGTITRTVPNTLVEWKSLPGSTVSNFGFIRVDPNYDASTRVLVRMFYRPPAGILGRFLAEMFGVDPKRVLAQDLKRLKTLFEKEEGYMKEMRKGGEQELLKTATT